MATRFHIVHILFRLDTGGLENGVVNLINHLDDQTYQHTLITLNGYDPEFAKRIQRDDVEIIDVAKQPGRDFGCFKRIYKILKARKPDCLHTRNLTSIEYQLAAFLAGVPFRIHGEHGWEISDVGGTNKKNQLIRRMFKPFVHEFIGLSLESIDYLKNKIGVSANKINHICNGVDTHKFTPENIAQRPADVPFQSRLVFGTVGRLAKVKNQTMLLDAYIQLRASHPQASQNTGLIIVGDGELMTELQKKIDMHNLHDHVWLAGNRHDVCFLMPAMSVFVLPSLAEGISNTMLEAMASGLPVIATDVGGNKELLPVAWQQTNIVASQDTQNLYLCMLGYVENAQRLTEHSVIARQHCAKHFSIENMVERYHQLYQSRD